MKAHVNALSEDRIFMWMWVTVLGQTLSYVVGFEVFTAVILKSIIFWDITPCSP
jgi:hypothetical protein